MDAENPPLWLTLPGGFTSVDPTEDLGDRMTRTAEQLDALFPDAAPEQKLSAVIAAETAFQAQLREGAVHVSGCLVRAEDGEPVHGMFTVFLRPQELGPPGSYPARVAEELAEAWPDADVGVVDLPVGRAALVARDVEVPVPGALWGVPGSTVSTVRQLELLLPHPWSPHVVAAVFTTEDLDHWDEWLPLLATAFRGISFHPPRDESADGLPAEQWDTIRKAFG
ncbi:hypothetical protein GCM10018790_30470 [Kitasatospora xanthocidica]|uniref:hypothetical protein n=1 Tax=Kitasatospora xanthocidica TaxID=83382 RepID=UPI00167BFFCA|nr:hypothetical protein [Kitasatospora xanthocidica]GHF50577.1 hypothetical protein GCM10018790_30470 [Kitasatospora xanthocidica]